MSTLAHASHAGRYGIQSWYDVDFYIYPRQSHQKSKGNQNTFYQEEDLPRLIEEHFGIDREKHEHFKVYKTETKSASDGKARFRTNARGERVLQGWQRTTLLEIIDQAKERWWEKRRPAVLCVTMLNRASRSNWTLPMLEDVATETEGHFFLYSLSNGAALLNPLDQSDNQILQINLGLASKAESKVKRDSVMAAQERIARASGRAYLGGPVPLGYTLYACDASYEPLSDEKLRDLARQGMKPRRAFCVDPGTAPIVHDIVSWVASGLWGRKLIRTLVARHGPHYPGTSSPWEMRHIHYLLENSIYIGERMWRQTYRVTMNAPSRPTPTEAHSPIKPIRSPYAPSLDLFADELSRRTWQKAQRHFESRRRGPAPRNKGGRNLNVDLLFHGSDLLRCALCGARMGVKRHRSTKVSAEDQYWYTCEHRRRKLAQLGCQGHAAMDLDRMLIESAASLFANVREFAAEIRKEIQSLRHTHREAELSERLSTARSELDRMNAGYLLALADPGLPKNTKDALRDTLTKQTALVARLEQDMESFGSGTLVREKQRQLERLDGMLTFQGMPILGQKELLAEVLEAVWVWPDGVEIQYKGEEESSVEQRTGRTLRIARHWPILDFGRELETMREWMLRSELPATHLSGERYQIMSTGTRAALRDYLQGSGEGEKITPPTLLRILNVLRFEYIDMPALRSALAEELQERVTRVGSKSRVAEECGVARRTLDRVLAGNAERETTLSLAERVLGSLETYRVPPEPLGGRYAEMLDWLCYADCAAWFADCKKGTDGLPYVAQLQNAREEHDLALRTWIRALAA